MNYEKTPLTTVTATRGQDIVKAVKNKALAQSSTNTILWFVIKRHKFALVTVWAVVITICYLMPFVPDMLLSAI